jgi:hypothetical protein
MAALGATAAASTSDQAATAQPTATAAAGQRGAAVISSFRHVRTLSDDEEYLVAAAGVSDSSADTDELMGRVDWTLAANSDGEHDVPSGWVGGSNGVQGALQDSRR